VAAAASQTKRQMPMPIYANASSIEHRHRRGRGAEEDSILVALLMKGEMKIHWILYFSDTLQISMLELDMFDGQTSGVGYVSDF
jgi:hypothetical protein